MAACCAILGAAQAAITFNSASFPTCYGKEFTDRLFGLRRRGPTGNHDFDRLCTDLGIEHRLAPPMHPQTNGMVERFNGRIEDILQSHRFRSGEDLEQTILRYVRLYNGQLPQSVLKGRTPIDALKDGSGKGRTCSGSDHIITWDVTHRAVRPLTL